MTKELVREYTAAVQERDHKANKLEKKKILDEFVKVSDDHRKAAIRLLEQETTLKNKPSVRPGSYDEALRSLESPSSSEIL